MTCIVAYFDRENDCVYMGGDSAGSSNYDVRIRKDPKVFKNGEFMIGFTTSFRMGQLLMAPFDDLFPQKESEKDYDYLVNSFIPNIQKRFKEHSFTKVKNEVHEGGTFILVYRNKIYEIEDDFQVSEYYDDFDSVGCGSPYALGALKALQGINMAVKLKVEMALEIAAYFSGGVSAPFNVISNKNE